MISRSRAISVTASLLSAGVIAIDVAVCVGVPRFVALRQHRVLHTGSSGDTICGPRCVAAVLGFYEKPSDLLDSVRTLQFPQTSEGATFSDIQSLLEKKGICTSALTVPRGYRLDWRYPSIAYIASKSRLGHYVVVAPNSEQVAMLSSDGIADVCESRDPALLVDSYTVLATSPTPVSADVVKRSLRQDYDVTLFLLSMVNAISLLALTVAPDRVDATTSRMLLKSLGC